MNTPPPTQRSILKPKLCFNCETKHKGFTNDGHGERNFNKHGDSIQTTLLGQPLFSCSKRQMSSLARG